MQLNADLTEKLSTLSHQYVEIVDDYKQQINELKRRDVQRKADVSLSGSATALDVSALSSVAECDRAAKDLQLKLEMILHRKVCETM